MYNMDVLNKQIQVIYGRVLGLYQQPQPQSAKSDVLPIALKELGIASEELQVAAEELSRQNEALATAQAQADTTRLLYQSLFEFAPDAAIITTLSGTIQGANRAAVSLLNRHANSLVGRPFITCIAIEDRDRFRTLLDLVDQSERSRNSSCKRIPLTVRLHRRSQDWFEAELTVSVINNEQDEPMLLQWRLEDISGRMRVEDERKQAVAALLQDQLSEFHNVDRYHRGELPPIEPQTLWLVVQGVVKLTTLSQRGEEIMIGLATGGQVFGASLTKLMTYQAAALTDVKLVAIPISELHQSAQLSQTLLPRIMQRLQQTERFLAVHGYLRTCDRFEQLLQLLKSEIGEVTAIGTRLKVKLTHQDLASACCTTRVTVTRLLGHLQQEGKVDFDAQNHLIVKD
ncbi:helix-turn-helix domain-containing protein [Leptolyngbya sp. AN03gr2]|uniref:helix-turn-helix domain-containing protein n=1 Tax=unclassified Leptolyngbya TaxID=2650499 RepID=UPI003D31F46E